MKCYILNPNFMPLFVYQQCVAPCSCLQTNNVSTNCWEPHTAGTQAVASSYVLRNDYWLVLHGINVKYFKNISYNCLEVTIIGLQLNSLVIVCELQGATHCWHTNCGNNCREAHCQHTNS